MRTPPTRAELEATTELLFDVMTRCFAYFSWWTRIRPILEESGLRKSDIQLQYNTVTEGTLLAIRKVNDFFRPVPFRPETNNEKEDDVFSYDFQGFKGAAKFLHKDDFSEIHKRVGHITLREIRNGKVGWEMHRAVMSAATKYIEFAHFLQDIFFDTDETRRRQAADCERIICRLMSEMEHAKQIDAGTTQVTWLV